MKIKVLVLVIVAFFKISISFAGGPCQFCNGIYVNEDYDDKGMIAKYVIFESCGYEIYDNTRSSKSRWTIPEIMSSDRFGLGIRKYFCIRTWMQNEDGSSYYGLLRFTWDSNVLEVMWSEVDYPNEKNPNDTNYRIYHRQE